MATVDSGLTEEQLKIHRDFEARLAQREAERKKVREQQRSGFGENMNPDEKKAHFDKILKNLDGELDNVRGIAGIRAVEAKITELESLGISKGELAGPRSRLSQITQRLALGEKEKKQGRKKFRFKKREKKGASVVVEAKVQSDGAGKSEDAEVKKQLEKLAVGNQFVVDQVGTHDIPKDSDVLIKDIHGTSEQPAIVNISHTTASTVHVQNVSNTEIHCTVNTSIFLDIVKDSQIHVSCQQLRMHNSQKVTVHLDCSTRAIIEDSNAIVFKKLNENTPESHWKTDIDDFNWLSKTDQSPNFSVCDWYDLSRDTGGMITQRI